jgi:hypothetical protein
MLAVGFIRADSRKYIRINRYDRLDKCAGSAHLRRATPSTDLPVGG